MARMQIEIPPTIDEAEHHLNRLAHAVEWERAAIVACYVEPDFMHGKRLKSAVSLLYPKGSEPESASAFAKRRIYGLRSKNTVLKYARAWLIYAELPRPIPGEVLDFPDLPFPTGAPKPEEYLPPPPQPKDDEARQQRLLTNHARIVLYEAKEVLEQLEDRHIANLPQDVLELAMEVSDLLRRLGIEVS